MMKPQRFVIVLTVINLGLLFCLLVQSHSAAAQMLSRQRRCSVVGRSKSLTIRGGFKPA
jgi:hypothetical protein